MQGIGYKMDVGSAGCYRAGFKTAAVPVTGTTIAAGDAVDEAPPVVGNGCTYPATGGLQAAATYTNTTFTSHAEATTLYQGGPVDRWSINDAKVVTNLVSGL